MRETKIEDNQWRSVCARDASADGRFVYAVKSTGVYCRPTCPARRPKRVNVEFFTAPEGAERAGYRACLRCRPNKTAGMTRQAAAVAKACAMIESAEETPALPELAHAAGMSESHFHRVFKQTLGVTPRQYAAACRAEKLRAGLTNGGSVTDAIYEAGYGSSSRVYERAGSLLGMTPKQYRDGAARMTIRFAIADSPLGRVLAAATEKGVCTIEMGDHDEGLRQSLRSRFSRAELNEDTEGLRDWLTLTLAFLDDPSKGLALPLDIRGTAFQCRVWQALQQIPVGQTRSYGEVAASLGAPGSARAVARACASNQVALAIPCHRVVRGDGGLSGYRWGVARKRALLEKERAAVEHPGAD